MKSAGMGPDCFVISALRAKNQLNNLRLSIQLKGILST